MITFRNLYILSGTHTFEMQSCSNLDTNQLQAILVLGRPGDRPIPVQSLYHPDCSVTLEKSVTIHKVKVIDSCSIKINK